MTTIWWCLHLFLGSFQLLRWAICKKTSLSSCAHQWFCYIMIVNGDGIFSKAFSVFNSDIRVLIILSWLIMHLCLQIEIHVYIYIKVIIAVPMIIMPSKIFKQNKLNRFYCLIGLKIYSKCTCYSLMYSGHDSVKFEKNTIMLNLCLVLTAGDRRGGSHKVATRTNRWVLSLYLLEWTEIALFI